MAVRWRDEDRERRLLAERLEKKARKEEKSVKRALKDVEKGRVKPWVPGV